MAVVYFVDMAHKMGDEWVLAWPLARGRPYLQRRPGGHTHHPITIQLRQVRPSRRQGSTISTSLILGMRLPSWTTHAPARLMAPVPVVRVEMMTMQMNMSADRVLISRNEPAGGKSLISANCQKNLKD